MAVIKKIKATNGTTYDIEPANVAETSKKYLHKTTSNAAPNAHTHTVTATGSVSLGSNTTETGGVQYVEKITGGTSVNVGSSTHTHNYDKTTGVTLTANSATDTGRITYVESVTGGSAVSATPRYMKFTAGTTPKSGATPNHTSTASAANTDSGIDAVTDFPDFDGGSGSFSPTTKYLSAAPSNESKTTGDNSGTKVVAVTGLPNFSGGSGSLTSGDSGNIAYIASASHTAASLGDPSTSSAAPGGHVHTSKVTKNYTTEGTGSSYRRVLEILGGTSGYNSGNNIAAVTGYPNFSGGSATHTTKYLTHTHTGASLGTLSTGDAAPHTHTHSYDKATGVTLTANDSTGTGRIKYIQEATHSHTGASLGDPSTGNVAPNGHTHKYDKTTSVSLTAGTAPSMNFNTGSTSDAKYIYDVTGGSAVTPTTKYLSAAPSNTSTATGTPSATESVATAITPTKKYFHPSFSGTSATTGANSGSAVSAVTNITSNTTATDGIGYITDEE